VLARALPLLLALPLPLVALAMPAVADVVGKTLGAALERPVARIAMQNNATEHEPTVLLPLEGTDASADGFAAETDSMRGMRSRRTTASGYQDRDTAPRNVAIHVPASKVLQLAEMGARPGAVPVPANHMRPAGLRLFGVTGLGLGLRDGDVLTHAAGVSSLSEAEVVGAVIAARGRGVTQLSGRLYRLDQPIELVVEQPYIAPSHAAPTQHRARDANLRVARR
jgi:hypothetical protein